jgi:hypothetical protein
MTKLTEISRFDVQLLGTKFAKELAKLGEEYGIDIEYGGGRYGGATGEVKLKISCRDTGAGVSAAQMDFNRRCHWYGLAPTDFHRVFTSNGVRYRITGLMSGRASKYEVVGERVHDKRGFKFTADTVKRGLTNDWKRAA